MSTLMRSSTAPPGPAVKHPSRRRLPRQRTGPVAAVVLLVVPPLPAPPAALPTSAAPGTGLGIQAPTTPVI